MARKNPSGDGETVVHVDGECIAASSITLCDAELALYVGDHAEEDRAGLIVRALRVGLIALRNAGITLNVDYLAREIERLARSTDESNERAAQALEASLRETFADGDGRLPRTLERFLGKDGMLRRLVSDLFDDCVLCAVDQLLADLGGPVWTETAFIGLRTGVAHALTESVVYVVTVVAGVLAIANAIELRLSGLRAPSLAPSLDDIEGQLAGLVGPGFVAATGVRRLPDLLRYLDGIERRLDKLPTGAERDFDNLRRVQRLERRYGELLGALGPAGGDEDVEAIRWLIEELRISYFAQGLGTAQPVSEKRILREIDRWWSEAG